MKIIYSQDLEGTMNTALGRMALRSCYFKHLRLDQDGWSVTQQAHYHTGYEIHMIVKGCQIYELEDRVIAVKEGDFLLISPHVMHRVVRFEPNTEKYAVSFLLEKEHRLPIPTQRVVESGMTARMYENLKYVMEELNQGRESSGVLIENRVLELILLLLRQTGAREQPGKRMQDESLILSMARQFVQDNVEQQLLASTVAQYCHMSPRQMNRIFQRYEGMTLGEFIRVQRIRYAERLLAEHNCSMKEISERMQFSSEYYFSTFFKKYAGMSPSEYRRMLG